MELSFGEMLLIAVAIVVLFGPDKLPQIARDLGAGVRKMRGAMEDIKTEILTETDNPVSEIKKEIEKVKKAAQEHLTGEGLEEKNTMASSEPFLVEKQNNPLDDSYNGPVSR